MARIKTFSMTQSIKGKFVIPTLIMLIVALSAMTLINYNKTYQALNERSYLQFKYIAENLAQQTDQWVNTSERERVIAWSQDSTNSLALSNSYIGKSARKRLADSLNAKLDQYKQYEKISVIDMENTILVSTDDALLNTKLDGQKITEQTTLSDVTPSPTSGRPIVQITSPVLDKTGVLVGAMVADLNLGVLIDDTYATLKLGVTGYAVLMDANHQILAHPDKQQLFKTLPVYENILSADIGQQVSFEDGNGQEKLTVAAKTATLSWYVLVEMSESEAMASAYTIRTYNITMMLAVLVGVGLALYLIANTVTKPLIRTRDIFTDLAEGEGDLTRRIQVKGHDETAQLGLAFNTFIDKIYRLIRDVAAVSQEVASASTELAANTEQISQGMQRQSQQTMSVSGAVEQMNASVVEVARQSDDATAHAQTAGTQASQGEDEVNHTVQSMEELAQIVNGSAQAINDLGKRSEQIGQIINVINDIADQTNLLALNAAIEAARAGEHGRGFAVVADEVRKLSERTTKATEEVSQSIKAIQAETTQAVTRMKQGTDKVKDGVVQAQKAGNSLHAIVEGARKVSRMIENIAAASNEQATTSQEITRNIEGIDAITRNSVESTRQAVMATDQLSQKAEQLQHLVNQFKL